MNFLEVVDSFKKRKVAVVGDILLDRFMYGNIERINPEQPASPLVRILREELILGGAANVAHNLMRMGAQVDLYGILGNDDYAEEIKKLCRESNIVFYAPVREIPTVTKNRIIAHGQQIARFDTGEDSFKLYSENSFSDKLLENLLKNIDQYDLLIASDYNKSLFSEKFAQEIICLGKKYDVGVIAAPKPVNTLYFKGVNLVCQNRNEAESFTGINYQNGLDTLIRMGKSIHSTLASDYVVITCGEDGAFSYHNGDTEFIPTVAKEVADVTGAGDTFLSALSLGFVSGLSLHDATRLANYASGIAVSKVGTHSVSSKELIDYLEKENK